MDNYIVSVPVRATTSRTEIAATLQAACDDAGMAGDFHVVSVSTTHHAVLFNRSVADDAEYLDQRMREQGIDAGQAAREQVAAELLVAGEGPLHQEIASALKAGQGNVFCFGFGATLASVLQAQLAEAA